jgi:uncharacterized protein YneR
MSTSFEKYSDILLEAYQSNARSNEIAVKKNEILDDVFSYYGTLSSKILFIGFSPSLLKITGREVFVTQISSGVKEFLKENNVKFTYVDFDDLSKKGYSVIVATDEYFTFANTDQDQRKQVNDLVCLATDLIVTTLKDYKNQDFKEKDFSHPVMVRGDSGKKIFFEQYEYNTLDKNAYLGTNYVVDDESVMVVGPFDRRAMYFKQLAKFSLDAGAKNFLVHKNLMHKSIIKKNYEHIISIQI